MQFKRKYLIGFGIGFFILIFDIVTFFGTRWFVPGLVVALSVAWSQVWFDFFLENRRQRELESRFLDFVRNLAGAIKSGMPVPKAILHVSKLDYGPLSEYVRNLGYQVEWAVPIHKAMIYFSNSTKNEIIKRAVSTVIEAEQSGGNMEDVLASITGSLIEIKKIKESRRASVHSQILQSYIIFFVFIGVMIVIQKMLVPYLTGTNTQAMFGGGADMPSSSLAVDIQIDTSSFSGFVITISEWFTSLNGIFLMLALIQGFFAGVIIGKLSEGDITSGLKHSIVLMTIAFFVMTVVA
ncbi:hypothetical protein GF358_00385 [Candidatus Woesearchaeota archaeon]|nr:hypothetical protein [Candidatus Woesearchaeota archaeon]